MGAGLLLLLRQEPCPAHAPRWHALPPLAPLRQALAGKRVIEFPTVVVVRASEAAGYALVGAGDEDGSDAGPGAHY